MAAHVGVRSGLKDNPDSCDNVACLHTVGRCLAPGTTCVQAMQVEAPK